MNKHHHILNAASNLLGIALVIIAGLNVSGWSRYTVADEIGWGAAISFSLSCMLSYFAIRYDGPDDSDLRLSNRFELWADRIFMIGLTLIVASVAMLAVSHGAAGYGGGAPT